ncbi:MAG: hypothetical protein CSA62_11890 [Planctomycetota bacterium]|nr:MAG: hypothetical protein CSA62_11890 [Planctomycetota bacterium]
MGYDLRITRSIDWTSNRGQEIPSSEWLDLVESDPELRLDPAYGPFAARFGKSAFFDWYEGNVLTTDADFATVSKLLRLAEALSGIVQGDNGEFYDTANQWSRERPRGHKQHGRA